VFLPSMVGSCVVVVRRFGRRLVSTTPGGSRLFFLMAFFADVGVVGW
jgi:hypothetical protein